MDHVLNALAGASIPFAVAHGEERLADGYVDSDVDLIMRQNPFAAFLQLEPGLVEAGLLFAQAWENAEGGFVTRVLCPAGWIFVDFDCQFDPFGRGRLRMRTAFAEFEPGVRWPVLASDQQECYAVARAFRKGNRDVTLQRRARCDGLFAFPIGPALAFIASRSRLARRLLPLMSMVNRILITPTALARIHRRLSMRAGRIVVADRGTYGSGHVDGTWPSPPRLIRNRWQRRAVEVGSIRPRIFWTLTDSRLQRGRGVQWIVLVNEEGPAEAARKMHRITTSQMQETSRRRG